MPDAVMLGALATGANVPPQLLVVVTGEATTMFPGKVGNVSLKVTAVIAVAVPFVSVKLNVLGVPSCTGVGLNTLLILGKPTAKGAVVAAT